MSGPRRVDYVVVYVKDLAKSIEFYRDVVGLEFKFQESDSYAEFATEGCKFGLYADAALPELIGRGMGTPPSAEVVFLVDNIDELSERLKREGIEIFSGPIDRPWGHRTLHFSDPDGNVVEYAQEIPRKGTTES